MTTPHVAILEPGYASYETESQVLSASGAQLSRIGSKESAVPTLRAVNPAAILVRERAVSATEIDACPNLKVVVRYGVGVDNIDIEHANRKRIYVANVPDYGAENEVSEHAVALYLAAQRRITSRDQEVRSGCWGIGQAAPVPNRENAVLGLIGCGRIGLVTARKFRALGFSRVIAFDPYLDEETAKEVDVERVDLGVLCSSADVVSLHAPLTPDTYHILNAESIALMKPGSIVVNVSRGGLVDEAALARALEDNHVFGAGIDVFEQEPVSLANPLLKAPNVVVSDHTAWYSERSVAVLQRNAAMEIQRVFEGKAPRNWVNPW